MDNKVAIEVALANINSTSQILSDNPSFDVISSNLNAIKLILENQLGGSTVTITPDKPVAPVAIPPRKKACLLYTSPSPRDRQKSRMPSSA